MKSEAEVRSEFFVDEFLLCSKAENRYNSAKIQSYQKTREKKRTLMLSHRRGLEMKEKEMREGITLLKMKDKQWWLVHLFVFYDGKGPGPPLVTAFLHISFSSKRS